MGGPCFRKIASNQFYRVYLEVYTFTISDTDEFRSMPSFQECATNREFNRSIESDLESADRKARVATLGLSNSLTKTCAERPGKRSQTLY